jgi:hypothetical protein
MFPHPLLEPAIPLPLSRPTSTSLVLRRSTTPLASLLVSVLSPLSSCKRHLSTKLGVCLAMTLHELAFGSIEKYAVEGVVMGV